MNVALSMLQKLRVSYLSELPGRLDDIEQNIMGLEKFGFVEENANQCAQNFGGRVATFESWAS